MQIRLYAFIILTISILATPLKTPCAEKPVRLTLTYSTTHGGLRTVVPPSKKNLPRLGLALAGGGARAAASIGVLKVLAREGIPVSAVAGTSMGALIGGLYAAGYSPDEIERIFVENDWNDIFRDAPSRAFLTQERKESGSSHLLEFRFKEGRFMPPSGLSAGQKLANLLMAKTLAASYQAEQDFNRLKIPFRAIAADIETGETVVLGHGLLHEAMRASAAIPLVFQPVDYQGRLLVDGGLANNLPVDTVKAMSVDRVLAVDSSARPERRQRLTTLFEIMSQSITLQVQRESRRQAALADLVITPDTSGYSFTDFPRMAEIIRIGEETATASLPAIKELMRPKTIARTGNEPIRITSLTIKGNSLVPDAAILPAMAPALWPREVTQDDLLAAMAEVFKLGHFSDVSLELLRDGE